MKVKSNRYLRIVILVPFIIIMAACSKSSNSGYSNNSGNGRGSGPGPNEVWMQNTAFNPSTLTVSVNTTVTWTNKDSYTHDVTATDNSFVSGNIPAGGTYSHQFTAAGTYNYRCTIHPGMNGTIVVKSGY